MDQVAVDTDLRERLSQLEELSQHADAETIAKAVAELPIHASQHHSLKHHLLGPSLTKAGQDSVDLKKVAEIIYEASKGSKFFNNEEVKDKVLTAKIERILKQKAELEQLDLKSDTRKADEYIEKLELERDLSQFVVHIDCDAFYAAVEEIDRPELKDVPFAVGQGVLTTCNYEARKYGCRSAMAGFVAKKLCPQLICLPLNFDKYTAKAREVRAILVEYDARYESSSIDEAYLNITDFCKSNNIGPDEVVEQLRSRVKEECKVTISAGIAPNAKIAKICSNKNKPNGQFRVPNDRNTVMSFMSGLPVRKVNGVGRVLERELQAIGINTCGDIYTHRAYLNRLFGEKAFQFLMQTHLGLGRTNVQPAEEHERKSVGTESTFRDISDKTELREKLRHTAEELEKDLARVEVKGRTLVLKIKLHTYEVFTRQVAPPKAVSKADELYNYSLPMLAKLEKELPSFRLRLMGLRCTHLVSTKKADVDFFRQRATVPSKSDDGVVDDQGGWQVWPESEFELEARRERQEEFAELEKLSQEYVVQHTSTSTAEWHEPFGRYKYGSEPNTPEMKKRPTSAAEELWDCPICLVPQVAHDRDFNTHIDLCLSKQTIREAVAAADDSKDSVSRGTLQNQEVIVRPSSTNGVKRKASTPGSGPSGASLEPRQKRLFFA